MSDLMEKTLEQIKKHLYDHSKTAENIIKAERRQALNEKLAEGDVEHTGEQSERY